MTGENKFLGFAILVLIIMAIAIGGGCSMFGSESLAAPVEELDQRLVDLYRQGIISSEGMFAFCNDRDEVDKLTRETRMGYPV